MPVLIQDHGRDNRVAIAPDVAERGDATIVLNGSGINLSIGAGVTLSGAGITLGDRCSLVVGGNCRLAAIELLAARDAHVAIGARTEFTWSTRIYLHEPGRIAIGEDCLIASGTLLTNSDMHSILDVATGQRINPAADIVLADRVWLAYESTILKGGTVGTGSVIGYRSTVGGDIPPHSLAVGAPARVVRSGITWDPRLL